MVLYLAAYCVATSTHVWDLATRGMYRVQGIPQWINWFWLALTFADPIAALTLIAWVPAGVGCMLAIIYADVAINAFVIMRLDGISGLISFFFLCQAGFLVFITVTFAPLLRSVARCAITESGRLYLRPLRLSDALSLARVLADPDSMRWYPRPYTPREIRAWILRNRKRYRKEGFGLWAVILKERGDFAGDCGVTLQRIDGDILPEIGYHTLGEYRGQGIATEAAGLAIEYCRSRFGIREIYSYCQVGNAPSRRVMEKLGLNIVKTYQEEGHEKVVYKS